MIRFRYDNFHAVKIKLQEEFMISQQEIELIKILWDYMNINDELIKCNCILCFGNSNIETAKHAVKLYLEGYSDLIIFTGGLGKITSKIWNEAEADMFSKVALEMGVPKEKILIENKSTNTGENVEFSLEILKKNRIEAESFIITADPMAERRAYATSMTKLSGKKVITSAPDTKFEEYLEHKLAIEGSILETISNFVGDIYRMDIYAKKGWQIPQEIPDEVFEAAKKLADLGYDKYICDEN